MKKDCACLLIHGFSGGKSEVLPLYHKLTQNNIDTYMVSVAGHSKSYLEMYRTGRESWKSSVKSAVEAYLKSYDTLILVGFSMGGLLSTYMTEYPLRGIVFASTPVFLSGASKVVKNLEKDFWTYAKQYARATIKVPPKSLSEFMHLLKETKSLRFKNVKCPCLVMHAKDDDIAHVSSAKYIYENLGGEKRKIIYERGGHKVFCGECGEQACDDALRFILNKMPAKPVNGHTL